MLESDEKKSSKQQIKRKRAKTASLPRSRVKVSRKQTETFTKDELNLRVDLRPLSHYVPDRDNLVDQLFTILSPEELQKMIPPTLQSYTLNEIRERILIEAKKYQDKQILDVIEGAVLNDGKPHGLTLQHVEAISTTFSVEGQRNERESVDITVESGQKGSDMLELCPDQGEVDSLIDANDPESKRPGDIRLLKQVTSKDPSFEKEATDQGRNDEMVGGIATELASVGTEWVSSLAKSQLEILELEMRARAIRSLMKAQGIPVSEDESEVKIARPTSDDENTPEVISTELEEPMGGNTPSGYESDPIEEVVTPELRLTGEDDDDDPMTSSEEFEGPVDEEPLSEEAEEDALDVAIEEEEREKPDVVIPTKPLEEEVTELLDMMVLKVVSDEVEARKKQERRDRRNLRKTNSKVFESDVEEGQILDDSDSDEISN